MADADEGDQPHPGWTVQLRELQHLEREEGDEGEWFFTVEFELSGLGVSGTLSVLITDPLHETTIVSEAFEQLHAGLQTYARVVGRRKAVPPIDPQEG